jgi:hypothetical protein
MDWCREADEDELKRLQEQTEEEMPRGWRPSPETIEALQKPREATQLPQDYPVQGDAAEIEKLAAGMQRLESTDTGQPLADAIRDHGTITKFGPLDEGDIAIFDRTTNEITISEGLKEASPEVLAAHMAHEGTHVQWNAPNSIDQEYHAFKAEDEVWNDVEGDQTDMTCDGVHEMVRRGEAEAKEEIRQMYPELPEYQPQYSSRR